MKKRLSRLPRLSRKQKTVRNLAAVILCVALAEWLLAFPCLTRWGVLRRAEHQFLLEHSQLLFTTKGIGYESTRPHTLYARNGDLLLAVNYLWTPLGYQPWPMGNLWREEDGICLQQGTMGVAGSYLAFGDLEEAAAAELTVTLAGDTWERVGYNPASIYYEETYTAQGKRKNPHCFTFQLEPHHTVENKVLDGHSPRVADEEQSVLYAGFSAVKARDAVLRLYDKNGALIHEKTVPRVEWDEIYWN